jgi:prephenate dehydratase
VNPFLIQSALKIGIQGVRASFHDVAAQEYFKGRKFELCECASFRRLCDALAGQESDFSLMAIENSIAGSILPNYLLLERFKFKIVGEVYLRIEMNLMALADQKIEDLQVVQSHPMALFQCEDFLALHPHLKVLEVADTAESAQHIKEKNLKGHAAIASRLAAEVYALNIIAAGIETNKQNYTRFLVISRGERPREDEIPDKASLRFETSHQPGSLNSILSTISDYGLNMTKIQSVPILGRPYEYSFHVDLEWNDLQAYKKALVEIQKKAINVIHFGEYKKGERPIL